MGGSNVQRGNVGEGGSDWAVKEGLRAVFMEAVKGTKNRPLACADAREPTIVALSRAVKATSEGDCSGHAMKRPILTKPLVLLAQTHFTDRGEEVGLKIFIKKCLTIFSTSGVALARRIWYNTLRHLGKV